MAEIRITVKYPVKLEHYPEHIKTEKQAYEFDVQQINDGNADIGLLLEADDWKLEVVD